jgi:hypothetical protein
MSEQLNNLQILDESGTLRGLNPNLDSLKITTPFEVGNDVKVGGDLTVSGDIVSRGQVNLVVQDAVIDLGLGNLSGSQPGGFTVQVQKYSGFTALSATAFQSKADASGDANFTVADASTLSVGDVVAISGATDGENDGYFVVKSKVGGVVSVEPSAMTGLPFAQTDFKTASTQSASVYKIDLAVVVVSDGSLTKDNSSYWPVGTLVTAYQSPATKSGFQAVGAYQGPGDVTLDEAYVSGNTITTSAAKGGDVIIAGDQKLSVTASGGLQVTNTSDLQGAVTMGSTLSVTGESTLASAKVSDLTSGRVVLAGAAGALEDSDKLTFNGTTLAVTGDATVSGMATLATATVSDLISGRVVLAGAAGRIADSGNLTFNGSLLDITGAAQTSGNATVGGNLSVTGTSAMTGNVTMAGTLGVTGAISGSSASLSSTLAVTGESTLASATVSDINPTEIVFGGTGGSLEGTSDLTYDGTDFKVGASFAVTAGSGNTSIGGTLTGTGAASLSSTLAVAGNLSVNTDKFTVAAASGNTAVAGTLSVAGESTLASATVSDLTPTRIVFAGTSGALVDSSDLIYNGTEFKIGADQFVVTKSNGNTAIAGTLDVTAAATLDSTLDVAGMATLAQAKVSDLALNSIVLAGADGRLEDSANLTFDGTDFKVGAAFTVAQASGNTSIGGTLTGTGAASLSSTLAVAGDLSVNTDKFTVAATSGNTAVAGTLNVAGEATLASAKVSDLTATHIVLAGNDGALEQSDDLTFNGTDFMIGGDKFVVTKSNGNTDIAGTLGVDGAVSLASTLAVTGEATLASATVSDLSQYRVVLAGLNGALVDDVNLTFNGTNLVVGNNKVTIAQLTGNTAIDGTLNVAADATFTATGGASNDPDFQVDGYAQFAGVMDLDGSIDADVSLVDVLATDQVAIVSSKSGVSNALYLSASAGGAQIVGATSSKMEIAANSGSDQTLTIKAANAGAGLALVSIEAEEGISIKNSAGYTTINRTSAGTLLQVKQGSNLAFQVGDLLISSAVAHTFDKAAGVQLTANASAQVAAGTICAFDTDGKMISANAVAGANSPSAQDEVTRYPIAAAVNTTNANSIAPFQSVPGTMTYLKFDTAPTGGLVGQAVFLGAGANAGKASLTAPTTSNASIWRVGILGGTVADANGNYLVYWHPQYLGRRPVA